MSFAGMLNRLHGQPESYEKKSKYRFGRTLGAGTYGVVREADGPTGKVAIKIILKKNVKGNEQMVYDELALLQRLQHPHIVKFVDWFESRDKFYIVTELATGGELFDRICDQGKFTEKDASQTIKQILGAVSYLHQNNVVHRDLKPENLIYVTQDLDSDLVLADFGIAKTLDKADENLKTMAGSFGYAAPEVMAKEGHGKPVDMWSLGVITYTLLCGYSPFRSENLHDLLDECTKGGVIFHERYWKEVSPDAKDFINGLIVPKPSNRWTAEEALGHIWISGKNAREHDLLPEFKRAREARAKLQKVIMAVRLQRRIAKLKEDEGESETAEMGDAHDALNDPSISPATEKRTTSPKDLGSVFQTVARSAMAAKKAEAEEEEMLAEETKRLSFQPGK